MITLTDLAKALRKSPSACSQIVKKLVAKGLLTQISNQDNRRMYYLRLTAFGTTVFEDHEKFNDLCQKTTFDNLSEFTDEELMIHVKVQQALNRTYESDVQKTLNINTYKRNDKYDYRIISLKRKCNPEGYKSP